MTPNRRLDQLEPLVADGLQKIDRLIEGQGQLLEVATHADQKAETAAKGVANLTIKVNKLTDNVSELTDNFSHLASNVNHLAGNVNQLTGNVNQLTGNVNQLTDKVNQMDSDQVEFREAVRREFQQVNQKFDLIIDLLRQK